MYIMCLQIKSYRAIQMNGNVRLYPGVALVTWFVKNYCTSAKDCKSAHSFSIHVIIELEARRFSISRYKKLKLCVFTSDSGWRCLNIHVISFRHKKKIINCPTESRTKTKYKATYLTHWYDRNLDLYLKTRLNPFLVSSQRHLSQTVPSHRKARCQSCKMH